MKVLAHIEILDALRRCGGAAQPIEIAWWTGCSSDEARQALALLSLNAYVEEVGESYVLTAGGHAYFDLLLDVRDTPRASAELQIA